MLHAVTAPPASGNPPVACGAQVDRATLAGTPMFHELPDRVLARLETLSQLLTVPAHTRLCAQGEQSKHLFLLLEGQVTLSTAQYGGSSAVVEVVQPGGHFILTAVLARMPHLMSAHTTTIARVIAVEAEGLLALIHQEPLLASPILRAEALDFSAMVRQVCDLKMRTTAQRLGCYLLDLSPDVEANTFSFRLPFDKRLLAAKLGCRQENLSRAFAALRNIGVEIHGARVTLHDIARLRDFSQAGEAGSAG